MRRCLGGITDAPIQTTGATPTKVSWKRTDWISLLWAWTTRYVCKAASAPSAASAGPVKTITKKITAEDAQKQVDELADKLTATKEQLDDAQRALQVQANRASARERGLHDHIAESSSEATTRKQELEKMQRENKSLLEERQELKARLEKLRRESEKRGSGGGGSAACAVS